MTLITYRNGWIILTVFILALILSVMPIPIWAKSFRPQWLTLVLIYWCLAIPHKVNIGSAWILGIIQDVLCGTLLGQRALALSIVAFATITLHLRIRIFPLWQQSFAIMVLLLLDRLLDLWIIVATGQPIPNLSYWIPALTSSLLWPWLYIILRDVRKKFNIV
jgi:rod shape-determining protein MreD